MSAIIGNTEQILAVTRAIAHVAPTATTVLLSGEIGVGKTLAAQSIHHKSPFSSGPFVKLHCSGLHNAAQLESTQASGVSDERIIATLGDYFRSAKQGSLYLDEVADLPAAAQSHLSLLLENAHASSDKSHTLVRFIIGSTRDLHKQAALGLFREDLLYRINIFPVRVPPLRERMPDILLLARTFLKQFRRRHGKNIRSISPGAFRCLMLYDWPGNVRELENVIAHASLLCNGAHIKPEHLPDFLGAKAGNQNENLFKTLTESFEKSLIRNALEIASGNQSEAARLLGATKRIIQYKVGVYDIDYRGIRKRHGIGAKNGRKSPVNSPL